MDKEAQYMEKSQSVEPFIGKRIKKRMKIFSVFEEHGLQKEKKARRKTKIVQEASPLVSPLSQRAHIEKKSHFLIKLTSRPRPI